VTSLVRIACSLSLVAALLGVAGLAAAATSPTVKVSDDGFAPETVTIRAGDAVTWQNTSVTAHSVVADDGAFDSGPLAQHDQFANVFTQPGRFAYHDGTDPAHTGLVVVKAAKPTATPKGTPEPTPPSGTLPPALTTPPPTAPPASTAGPAAAASTGPVTPSPAPAQAGGSSAPASPEPGFGEAATGASGLLLPLGVGIGAVVLLGVVLVLGARRRRPAG
jgi:plastocyanin